MRETGGNLRFLSCQQRFIEELLGRLSAPPPQPTTSGLRAFAPAAAIFGVALSVFCLMLLLAPPPLPAAIGPLLPSPEVEKPEMPPLLAPPPSRVDGVFTFRGDFARTGRMPGPAPRQPRLKWRYPKQPMCSESAVGGEVKTWCGTGWTGQPVAWRRSDGVNEVAFGAFDRRVHFVDLDRGRPTRHPLQVGDIIKGSATLDPEGEPLLFIGGRDNRLRVIALDRPRPQVLWTMSSDYYPGRWNDDWDGTPLVRDDFMYAGGEDGIFYAVKLNRDYDRRGLIMVRPEMMARWPAWNRQLRRLTGDGNNSIESSIAAYGERLYFTNSAGRLVGLNGSRLALGRAEVVFDFWLGDDADATLAVDEEGMLYAAVELERYLPRSDQLGQLLKINPYRPADPVVWSIPVPPGPQDGRGGSWASPALGEEAVYFATNSGLLLVVDRETGHILQTEYLAPHAWSSPVLCRDTLVVATCQGEIISWAVAADGRLRENWRFQIPGRPCIESTPLVWRGHIVVGARDGFVYALEDKPPLANLHR